MPAAPSRSPSTTAARTAAVSGSRRASTVPVPGDAPAASPRKYAV